MNVNDGTVPCPTCRDAVLGSTLKAVVPLRARITELEAALREACDEYDDAARYKGYLRTKHRDDETLARLRALLTKGAAK